ncbi:MAG: hypothetical protein MO846_03235 [Candidatus Devosia symbiotica]|nr:hypothetical protein [Candidatus Devosia symbiotica]
MAWGAGAALTGLIAVITPLATVIPTLSSAPELAPPITETGAAAFVST